MENPISINENYTGPTVIQDYFKKIKSHSSFSRFLSKANKRYFSLYLDRGTFFYTKTQKCDLIDTTRIYLDDITKIYIDDSLSDSIKDFFWKFGFVVETDKKKYELLAHTKQSRDSLLLAFSHVFNNRTQSYLYDPQLIRPEDDDLKTRKTSKTSQQSYSQTQASVKDILNNEQEQDVEKNSQAAETPKAVSDLTKPVKVLEKKSSLDQNQDVQSTEVQLAKELPTTSNGKRDQYVPLGKPAKKARILGNSIKLNDHKENEHYTSTKTVERFDSDSSAENSLTDQDDALKKRSFKSAKKDLFTALGLTTPKGLLENQESAPQTFEFEKKVDGEDNIFENNRANKNSYKRPSKHLRSVSKTPTADVNVPNTFNLNLDEKTENENKNETLPVLELNLNDNDNKNVLQESSKNLQETTPLGNVLKKRVKMLQTESGDKEIRSKEELKKQILKNRYVKADLFNNLQQAIETNVLTN